MTDSRLDTALVERGLARSRTLAAKLIADGLVTVDGVPVVKASTRVTEQNVLATAPADHYLSRAAHKLIAALDGFGVPVEGRRALDVGASTGGFTQVLLERGASTVLALDVGHGQLAPEIAADERVTVIEGFNARYMTAETLTGAAGGALPGTDGGIAAPAGDRVAPSRADGGISLVVGDLSFISLLTVLPALVQTVGLDADYVLLIKPQFEVGRTGIREGIVRQGALRTDAVNGVLWGAWDLGLNTAGVLPSPIAGGSGNHEYLVRLSATHGSSPAEWSDRVTAMTETT